MSPSIIPFPNSPSPLNDKDLTKTIKDGLPALNMNIDDTTHLELISPVFSIKTTKYGGRGAFATGKIPKGTIVLNCDRPVSSTIIKAFRKEVCNECFQYFDGKNLKYKLGMNGQGNLSLFFCSEECKDNFVRSDPHQVYLENLLSIEKHYLNGLKKPEQDLKEPDLSQDMSLLIEKEWNEVEKWDSKIQTMKPSKKINIIPQITENEYTEIKYIVGVLYQLSVNPDYTSAVYECNSIEELNLKQKAQLELNLFDGLQSSEREKVLKYPYLLYSYINIYKFIKLVCTNNLQNLISPDRIRSILGKNLSNAFGIWSEVTSESEDKEYFGFGVYPSASYFNHSCAPNLKKSRNKSKLAFCTLKDIQEDEELCIDYGNYLDEDVHKRRKELSEWFFECGCEKCIIQLKE